MANGLVARHLLPGLVSADDAGEFGQARDAALPQFDAVALEDGAICHARVEAVPDRVVPPCRGQDQPKQGKLSTGLARVCAV